MTQILLNKGLIARESRTHDPDSSHSLTLNVTAEPIRLYSFFSRFALIIFEFLLEYPSNRLGGMWAYRESL